ncbi:PhzF family phenazine biosynthesis protein [Lysobacter tyrosinilyticus]
MSQPEVLHYAAFTDRPDGGNPAGVVLDARGLDEARMLAIAAKLGYSESAFLFPRGDDPRADGSYDIRYFAPTSEVRFCGHATIATAVALAEHRGAGTRTFHTRAGEVVVDSRISDGRVQATLTSVEPYIEEVLAAVADELTAALGLSVAQLDEALPARFAYAGGREFILAVRTREQLAALAYDFDALLQFCHRHDLQGGIVVWRESPEVYHARGPFPVGGVIEDPATGAAAAAFGAYLRELELVSVPSTIVIHQGVDMGRPSLLTVDIGVRGGIRVSGQAVKIPQIDA